MKPIHVRSILLVLSLLVLCPTNVIPSVSASPGPLSPLLDSGWGSWQDLLILPPSKPSWPVVAQNQDGRLEIFYGREATGSTDDAIYHMWQTSPGGAWSLEDQLGAPGESLKAPSFGINLDGRIEVFAQQLWYGFGSPPIAGPHLRISHIWQTAPNDGWSGWASLDQPFTTVYLDLWDPYVGTNQDGRLDVFGVDQNGNGDLWHRWQTGTGAWSVWTSLGKPAGLDISPLLATGQQLSGSLVVFAQASNGEIFEIWQQTVNDENSWSAWTTLGKPTGINLSRPAVSRNKDGRLELFATGDDGGIWNVWQLLPNNVWIPFWGNMGKPSGVSFGNHNPVVGTHSDGTMDVFVVGDDYYAWHRQQTAPSNGWGSWQSLYRPFRANLVLLTDQITVGRNKNGLLDLFAIAGDDSIYYIQQKAQVFLPLMEK